MVLSKVLWKLADILIPKSCLYCGIYADKEICDNCINNIQEYEPESFISRKKSKNWSLSISEKESSSLEKVFYFYYYNEIIHALIESIKYNFNKDNIKYIIELFNRSKEFQKIDFSDFDYITYVPLTLSREKWRGFNHTKFITHEISLLKNIPYFQILEKPKETNAQIDLSKDERLTNLLGSFKIKNNLPVTLQYQKILIIDDICTTGSTLIECARTIKTKYPDLQIYGLCLARGK